MVWSGLYLSILFIMSVNNWFPSLVNVSMVGGGCVVITGRVMGGGVVGGGVVTAGVVENNACLRQSTQHWGLKFSLHKQLNKRIQNKAKHK